MRYFICILMLNLMCHTPAINQNIDIQGHRGCRGLIPENTVEGFLQAIDLGVTTLEMDLVISGDQRVIVSHEPFFHHRISTGPGGLEITEQTEKDHNIYKLTVPEIIRYDVGIKAHPGFPHQRKMPCIKPTLDDVIDICELYIRDRKKPPVYYNMEIKRHPDYDGIFHPDATTFARLVYEVVKSKNLISKTTIQSFDIRSLQEIRKLDDTLSIALLVEGREDYRKKLDSLRFKPQILSPYYLLVDNNMVEFCRQNQLKLIPWTVNDTQAMRMLIEKGVDGIITDYPDKLIEVIKEKSK